MKSFPSHRRISSHTVEHHLICGRLENCAILRGLLQALPAAPVARDAEVLDFIDRHALAQAGIGYIDAHLLCAVALAGRARLWTRDKRLGAVAESLASSHTT